jgi:Sulfotransferase domain
MGSRQLRIALVSTPRSGNTWFRRLLATTFMLEDRAVHNPEDLVWHELPERFVLQCHWHKFEPFTSLLEENLFRVVVLSRHPLDVLISILHFAPHNAETARWLEGDGGNEVSIYGAKPRDSAFLEYAAGPRAAALLSVSHEWRQAEGRYSVRYEDVVRDPAGELKRLAAALDQPVTPEVIAEAIASNSIRIFGKAGLVYGKPCSLPRRLTRSRGFTVWSSMERAMNATLTSPLTRGVRTPTGFNLKSRVRSALCAESRRSSRRRSEPWARRRPSSICCGRLWARPRHSSKYRSEPWARLRHSSKRRSKPWARRRRSSARRMLGFAPSRTLVPR